MDINSTQLKPAMLKQLDTENTPLSNLDVQ